MDTFVAVVHVITALVLIALVLLQDSKSSGLGGAFGGGGSNSILGTTGASTLAQRLTRGAAVVFAITSLSLTLISKQNKSVVDSMALPAPTPSTAQPAVPVTDPMASPSTTLPTQ